jgi:wyosine [tRNA(Phe)-imidazoG37] synthetase (radical SAM superfamily)
LSLKEIKMSTFLFDRIVFGPVKSRRLGVSLGINLLPLKRKVCNFNCIYCECGWTGEWESSSDRLPGRQEVYDALDRKLYGMKSEGLFPDVITYAGNGEPTLHPEFPGIIDDSIALRDRYFPEAHIAVLSNSTTIHKPEVREALLKVDRNILKLDSAFSSTITVHNQPRVRADADELIRELESFKGRLIIQTLFLRGYHRGTRIDNTTPGEINAWLEALKKIKPSEVMIYTISRDTPHGPDLEKVPPEELEKIARLVEQSGIRATVSG